MDESKLTPWFLGRDEPARTGVYMRRWPDGSTGYSRWDGARWMWMERLPRDAAKGDFPSTVQTLPWRGLAKEPKHG